MLIPTTGTLSVLVASRDVAYTCAPDISVDVTSIGNPTADLPAGKAWLTITSPAGWLSIDYDGDAASVSMGDAPVVDDTSGTTEQMFDYVSGLVGGSVG